MTGGHYGNIRFLARNIEAALEEKAPDIVDSFIGSLDELQVVVQTLAYIENIPVVHLVNQAINDFCDLVLELQEGRGRPATRSARALVEHTINFYSISARPDLMKRYEDHISVSAIMESEAEIGASELSRVDQRVYLHELKVLAKKHRDKYDSAISTYGSSFKKSWTMENLRDRAEKFGLGDLYPYYKLASSVMHGSPGGSKGTFFDSVDTPIFRLGPALQLCPLAYHEGFRAFDLLLDHLGIGPNAVRVEKVQAHVKHLKKKWSKYRSIIIEIDKKMTPKSSVNLSHGCVLINGRGLVRWVIVFPEDETLTFCEPPPGWQEGELGGIIDQIRLDIMGRRGDGEWELNPLVNIPLIPIDSEKRYHFSNFFKQSDWRKFLNGRQ